MRRIAPLLTLLALVAGGHAAHASAAADTSALAAARTLVRYTIGERMMEPIYQFSTQQASTQFEAAIQPTLGRALTAEEKQDLASFWYVQIKELLPYSQMETMIVPVVLENLSAADIRAANAFYGSPAGQRFLAAQPAVIQGAQAAGQRMGTQLVTPEWTERVMRDLRKRFPAWFENERGAEGEDGAKSTDPNTPKK